MVTTTTTTPKEAKISIKIMMPKDKNKVIFAEADSNFVDILFSFMTLPLATIARILNGCADQKDVTFPGLKSLYQCIKDLPTSYLSTEESKYFLLNPRSSAYDLCRKLKLNIDDTEPLKYFICDKCKPCYAYNGEYSFCKFSKCGTCGKNMDKEIFYKDSTAKTGDGGVFVSEGTSFIVTDDLRVMPNTLDFCVPLLIDLGINDGNQLQETTFDIGREQILVILKGLLLSDFSLTHLVFPTTQFESDLGRPLLLVHQSLMKSEAWINAKRFTLNVRLQKSTSKLLFVEAGEDFVDFVFGFLGIPLGVVVGKLLNSIASLDNLFASISSLGEKNCFKSQDVKDMLCDDQFS